jgi:hypothetical protein
MAEDTTARSNLAIDAAVDMVRHALETGTTGVTLTIATGERSDIDNQKITIETDYRGVYGPLITHHDIILRAGVLTTWPPSNDRPSGR